MPVGRTDRSTSGRQTITGATRLTVDEVIAELKISRSTFYYWRQIGKAPQCKKLPNGEIRVRRADLDAWWDGLEEAA